MRTLLILIFATLAILVGLTTAPLAQSAGSSSDPADGATWELSGPGSEDLLGGAASFDGMVTVSSCDMSKTDVSIIVYDQNGDEIRRRSVPPGKAKNMQFKKGESVFVESSEKAPSSGRALVKFA